MKKVEIIKNSDFDLTQNLVDAAVAHYESKGYELEVVTNLDLNQDGEYVITLTFSDAINLDDVCSVVSFDKDGKSSRTIQEKIANYLAIAKNRGEIIKVLDKETQFTVYYVSN